ncbi:recombination protein RecR [Patescibacteria group bacterium]|nr:MAG: recombination protein RecR [Patescibacteria group bacterium]
MSALEELERLFREFPGIGPRQAKRFVYFLLTRNGDFLSSLSENIKKLRREVILCNLCFRYFPTGLKKTHLCSICSAENRDHGTLLVVARDSDLETVEKSGVYRGLYFVLGGTLPILEKEPGGEIRIHELMSRLEKDGEGKKLKEIIFALNVNPEGENTADYIREKIEPLSKKYGIKISLLGRGLSTGLELEYSDPETLKYALKNRE